MRGSGPSDVFVDSNVLYSKTLLDWVALLYTDREIEAPFTVYWSDDVMAEAMYHLRRDNPHWSGARIARFRERLQEAFEIGHVRDYEIDNSYTGPDTHDAHVHAAASACGADYLLTCNVAHHNPGCSRGLKPPVSSR
ncbi:MAG TPA: PIN domain-containing protein, partial [Dermatophilaceae bacterium]|nr:PIN domain-containing protein [Dermatophilaceae bacterium]